MRRAVSVLPEAEAEMLEAATWYEARSFESAARFLQAVGSALDKLAENPSQYQVVEGEIRRAPIQRSPYGLMYVANEGEIVILSCFHGSRDPCAWRKLSDL